MTAGCGDEAATDLNITFDDALAGQRVDADGGAEVPGTQYGSRATFQGTLTGRRLVQGDPPWVWLELGDLTEKPEDFEEVFVWCEESFVYLESDDV